MKATKGCGVDVVLNSLYGELLHASWECVAKFGRMIELGKRDFLANGTLSLKPFIKNRAFFGVDLLDLSEESINRRVPRRSGSLLAGLTCLQPSLPVHVMA